MFAVTDSIKQSQARHKHVSTTIQRCLYGKLWSVAFLVGSKATQWVWCSPKAPPLLPQTTKGLSALWYCHHWRLLRDLYWRLPLPNYLEDTTLQWLWQRAWCWSLVGFCWRFACGGGYRLRRWQRGYRAIGCAYECPRCGGGRESLEAAKCIISALVKSSVGLNSGRW